MMSEVWSSAPVSGSELLVLLALADFADDGGECWPAIETLAAKARLKRRATQYAVRTLIDAGLLEVRPNAGPRTVNLYRVIPGGAQNAPVHEDAPEGVHDRAPRTVIENRHSELRSGEAPAVDRQTLRHLSGTEQSFAPTLRAWIESEGGQVALVNAYRRFMGRETVPRSVYGRIGRLLQSHEPLDVGLHMWRMFRLGRPAGDPLDLLTRSVAAGRRDAEARVSIRGIDPEA